MGEEQMPGAGAQCLRGDHEILTPKRGQPIPEQPRRRGPGDQRQREDHQKDGIESQSRVEISQCLRGELEHHQNEHVRQSKQRVGEPHQSGVEPAAQAARGDGNCQTEAGGQRSRRQANAQGNPQAAERQLTDGPIQRTVPMQRIGPEHATGKARHPQQGDDGNACSQGRLL